MSLADRVPDWIALDGAVNARAIVPGVLLRADNLQSLSARDVQTLIDEHGVEVVIDLRTDVEVDLEGPSPITREPGVRIEHRSLYPDSGENTDLELDAIRRSERSNVGEFSDETRVVRAYLNYVRRRPDSIVGAVRTIAREDRAVLVHCAAGKDRTGVVVALALDAVGVERGAIVADYLASADRIELIMRRLLSSPTYRPELEGRSARELAPVAGTLERFFEIVDQRFGGSVPWLTASGLGSSDLELLRARLGPGGAHRSARATAEAADA